MQKMPKEELEKTCVDCHFWFGRCRKGKVNKMANSRACNDFQPKRSFYYPSVVYPEFCGV